MVPSVKKFIPRPVPDGYQDLAASGGIPMSHSIYDNIISAKYDGSLDHPISMYDLLPYQRDSDYCNAEKLTLESGTIIKYYLCLNQMEACPINNHDDEIESILAEIQMQEQQRIQTATVEPQISEPQDGITPEQIQTLLKDPEEETEPDLSNAVNPFENVEDW